MIAELHRDVEEGIMSKIWYKSSDRSKEMYDELKKIFYKYTKDMYRKFKRFLEPADTLSNPVINPDMNDLLSHRERLNQTFKKLDKKSHYLENNDIVFRKMPEFLPKLESMPLNSNPNVQKAIER